MIDMNAFMSYWRVIVAKKEAERKQQQEQKEQN